MGFALDRLTVLGGSPTVADAVRRIEAGEAIESLGLSPADPIAVLAPLAVAAGPILEEHGDSRWPARLIGQGGWNASAMIDLCTGAGAGTADEVLARKLQRLEMQLLLGETARAVVPGF